MFDTISINSLTTFQKRAELKTRGWHMEERLLVFATIPDTDYENMFFYDPQTRVLYTCVVAAKPNAFGIHEYQAKPSTELQIVCFLGGTETFLNVLSYRHIDENVHIDYPW